MGAARTLGLCFSGQDLLLAGVKATWTGYRRHTARIAEFVSKDRAELRRALRPLRSYARHAVLSWPREWAMVRQIDLPEVDVREFRAALASQLDSYFPVQSEDAYLDVCVPRGRGSRRQAFVSVVPKQLLDPVLEKLGVLRRDPTKPRALELLAGAAGARGLPLVGRVAAGEPVLAEQNVEEYVEVPELAGAEHGEFVLRVKGESMRDAGILEGDHVIVRRQETAQDGDIVGALIDEEATVKRFYREADHVRLQPENREMEPIRTRDVRVLGRVVGVCRRVV